MDLKITLNKEELLRLCEKDPEFEIHIQRAALNYIRNSKLKPILTSEISREIEAYRLAIRNEIPTILKDLGITEQISWGTRAVTLSDSVREKIKYHIDCEISDLIDTELIRAKQDFNVKIKNWEKEIDNICKAALTEEKIKALTKEILEKKLANLI